MSFTATTSKIVVPLLCRFLISKRPVVSWESHSLSKAFTTGYCLHHPRGVKPKVQRSKVTGWVLPAEGSIDLPGSTTSDERSDVKNDEIELHHPVMLREVMDVLEPTENQVLLDMTFGAGGHTKAILQSCPTATVYALDRDPVAHQLAVDLAERYPSRLHPLLGRFSDLDSLLKSSNVDPNHFDGVLIDAGCSSMQFDDPCRGFALSQDGSLDMRMDGTRLPSNPSAADVVNSLDAETLARILKTYGEERHARKVASMIVEYRDKHKPIESTQELATVVSLAFSHRQSEDSKDALGRRMHVATRTFQALRIFVNDELNELNHGLHAVKPYIRGGGCGRLAVLTFHSLEDRVVKRFLQGRNVNEKGRSIHERKNSSDWTAEEEEHKSTEWEIVHKKVLYASDHEVSVNPRSRSAKLRAAFKL